MSTVDQFTSVFKSAAKTGYRHAPVNFERVAVIADCDRDAAATLLTRLRRWLSVLPASTQWQLACGDDCRTVEQLLHRVEFERPQLIVTYRNLHSSAWDWPYTLGRHLDVLTQATQVPVVVIPHPNEPSPPEHLFDNTDNVMAATGHMSGDHALIRHAAALTAPGGALTLCHVEDDATFERYMSAIEKIPAIDSELARDAILEQLFKEPRDYIRSASTVLQDTAGAISVNEVITKGHRLDTYKSLIAEHRVDLLLLRAKDEQQLAMHAMTYPLAVELRSLPLLLL